MDARSILSTFLCVYRHGSQSKAALELHLTQPAISQQIKQLEVRLGQALFKKQGRMLVPTAMAHQLALKIGKPIDALEEVWNALKLKSIPQKVVHIAGISEYFSAVIAPNLQELMTEGIHCRFIVGYKNLEERLLRKEIDIAQFCTHVVVPGLEVEKLSTHEFILVGHKKYLNQLKVQPKKLFKTLNELPWVAYDESLLFIKEYFLTVFQAPFEGRIPLMVPDLWSILNTVIGGSAISVLPSYFCQNALKSKHLSVLYRPSKAPLHDFYLGWRDGALTNPYIKATKLFLQKTVTTALGG